MIVAELGILQPDEHQNVFVWKTEILILLNMGKWIFKNVFAFICHFEIISGCKEVQPTRKVCTL